MLITLKTYGENGGFAVLPKNGGSKHLTKKVVALNAYGSKRLSRKVVTMNAYEERMALNAYSKVVALNAYERKGGFAHLTNGMALNAYLKMVALNAYNSNCLWL